MKYLSTDEHSRVINKMTPHLKHIYDDCTLTWNEVRIEVSNIWLLYFMGTQYQEQYECEHVAQLMAHIQDKLDECIHAKYEDFIRS